jgi:hypothetical protein
MTILLLIIARRRITGELQDAGTPPTEKKRTNQRTRPLPKNQQKRHPPDAQVFATQKCLLLVGVSIHERTKHIIEQTKLASTRQGRTTRFYDTTIELNNTIPRAKAFGARLFMFAIGTLRPSDDR